MNRPDGDRTIKEDVHRLADALFDEVISDDELARLDALVCDNQAARTVYVRYVYDNINLSTRAGQVAPTSPVTAAGEDPLSTSGTAASVCSTPASTDLVPQHSAGDGSSLLHSISHSTAAQLLLATPVWLSALAVLMLLVASALWRKERGVQPPAARAMTVAHLTGADEPRWAEGATPWREGMGLAAGTKIELQSGLVELTYTSGARVILKGPAIYELEAELSCSLELGRLTAYVPPEAIGFTVRTPVAEVIDLGTEFGVAVDRGENTELHVFDGQVKLLAHAEGKPVGEGIVVRAGEARRIDAGGLAPRTTRPEAEQFVVGKDLKALAEERARQRLEAWRAYSAQMRDDPDLVVYYTFENESEAPAKLVNGAAATRGQHDGALAGGLDSLPAWTDGRWPGKGALHFSKALEQCVVVSHAAALNITEAITIALWCRPSRAADTGHMVNKAVAPRVTYNLVWVGEQRNIHRGLYFDWGAGARISREVLPSSSRWTHVVVTGDDAGNMVHYVDGKLVGRHAGLRPTPTSGDLQIGKAPWSDAQSQFDGKIDELAIFRRALSAEEVQRMYTAGKPR